MLDPQAFTPVRSDYRCEPERLGWGGYADTYRAIHVPTGQAVVFKQLRADADADAETRLRREVDVMSKLAGHPNLMPVFASDPKFRWYVMPEAAASLRDFRPGLKTDEQQRDLVVDVAAGLSAAHAENFVHRDVTPGNVLFMTQGHCRWVLADFGLVRRPLGQTTHLRTRPGGDFGTYGYVAPELQRGDPHAEASPKSDVYSLARVLQRAATGRDPLAGESAPPGPFRRAIRDAIAPVPDARSTLEEFVQAVERACEALPDTAPTVEELAHRAASGDTSAAGQLYDRGLAHPDDSALFLDIIATIDSRVVSELAAARGEDTWALVQQMEVHVTRNFDRRDFDYLNVILRWIEHVVVGAEAAGDLALFEDAAEAFIRQDVAQDRFRQLERTRTWLGGLRGESADLVARILRDTPGAVERYAESGWRPPANAAPSIAGVVGQAG